MLALLTLFLVIIFDFVLKLILTLFVLNSSAFPPIFISFIRILLVLISSLSLLFAFIQEQFEKTKLDLELELLVKIPLLSELDIAL